MEKLIRKATVKDVLEILQIYNYEVENGIATYDTEEKSIDEWLDWFNAHQTKTHPVFVCETDGRIAGYASLSQYREKTAYKTTVEISVYVHKNYRNQKIATMLMTEILKYAKECQDIHVVVSVITSGNGVSTRLHEKFGFTYCGSMHEVGMKFGKWLGIDNFELKVD